MANLKYIFLYLLVIVLITGCDNNEQNKGEEYPPVTPYWALGHIVWEDGNNTQEYAIKLIDGYLEHNIPVDGIIIDSPWELHYNDFVWDSTKYPSPDSMLQYFMDNNVHTLLWMTGNINKTAVDIPNQTDPDLDVAIEKGYSIVVNDSLIFPWWKGDGIFLDFTNPKAVRWWNKRLDRAFTSSIYGWKVDNMRLPAGTDSLKSSIGVLSERDFKRYYYDRMYDYTLSRNPEGIIFARPYSHQGGFNASISKLSVGWCGDFTGDWAGMKLQISNIYRSAEAGYGALACEIGGFSGTASTKEQLIRYTQFASMVATMDNGGVNGPFENHLPWFHDDETTLIYRNTILRHRAIRPYIFSTLVDAGQGKGNLINSVSFVQESHKLGEDLFFKAITSDTGLVSFRLPDDGVWYEWQTGDKYMPGNSVKKEYQAGQLPLFIRTGAVIPLDLKGTDFPGSAGFKDAVVILIYSPENRVVTYHHPVGSGKEYCDISIKTTKDGEVSVSSTKDMNYVFIVKEGGKPVEKETDKECGLDVLSDSELIQKKGKKFSFKLKD
ncbi:MAG: hypothetical protein GXO47_06170 [Chlorobi bacterium]|nr:hypothetical protein [Chlorobiota bacterium]